jgi:medium-chain acyl-[acyl-carrier-protein] hydrolase
VRDPLVRLVGFHHAGGSSATYVPLAEQLPQGWDLLLYDLPGRGKNYRGAPVRSWEGLVRVLLEELRPWTGVPLGLFGHSMGALVAAEVGRELCAADTPPVWIGVSGSAAPGVPVPRSRRLHRLEDGALLREVALMGGLPDRWREFPELEGILLELMRRDLDLVRAHQWFEPRGFLTCPVSALGGSQDLWAPLATMRAWGEQTSGTFRSIEFRGGHFYFSGEDFAGFAEVISGEMERSINATVLEGFGGV